MELDFEVNNDGQMFTVLIFDRLGWVVKVPKGNVIKHKDLRRISSLQTEIARQVDGVLPCWLVNGVLVMPKADGIRADYLAKPERERAKHLKDVKKREIERLGFWGVEASWKNTIYNPGEDKVYLVDCHRIERR